MSALMVLLATRIALGGFDNLWHHELTDFIVEDGSRRLPRSERILHTVLAINFGALLAVFAPTLLAWGRLPTAIAPAGYGAASWLLTAAAAGVFAWSVRDALAARRHFAMPTWRRRGLKAGRSAAAKTVLVTGATGFIGPKLVYRLVERGDRVAVYARNGAKAADLFGPHAEVITNLNDVPAATHIDAVVNLAGESIAGGLWTARRRARLLGSRLDVTQAVLDLCARLETPPKTWINASAIGYYGARGEDDPVTERTPPGDGFQAELCRRWEEAAAQAAALEVNVCALRFGVVLGRDGGALPAFARPVRLFAGAVIGNGRQWISWIHIDDLLELILFALDGETLTGPINATAPAAVRHGDFMAAIAAALKRPLAPFRVPAPLVRAALGELAELFVDGRRVYPERALELGFRFRHAEAGAALLDLLAAPRER